MAWAQRGSTTVAQASCCGSATANVSKPTGVVAGDLIVIAATAHNACCGTDIVSIATPSGFTKIDAAAFGVTSANGDFFKIATGSEGSTFAVTATGTLGAFNTTQIAVECYAFSGANASQPDITNAQANTSSSTNAPTPTLTLGSAGDLVFTIVHFEGSATFTPQSGFTALTDEFGAGQSVASAYQVFAGSGSTGTITNVLGSAKVSRGVTAAFNSASLAPPPFVEWKASYEEEVIPPLKNAQNSFIAEIINPQPITQNKFYNFHNPDVKPWPLRAQHSFIAQEVQPNAIPVNKFYPVYDAQVKPFKTAAQFTVESDRRINPQPIVQNNYYAFYPAEVKRPPLNSTGFVANPIPAIIISFTPNLWYPSYDPTVKTTLNPPSYVAQKINPQPIGQTDFYPTYEAQVKPAARAAQFSGFAQLLPAPIQLNNYYPAYEATVKAPPRAAQFSWFAETLAIPLVMTDFYPVYAAEVKAPAPASQFSGFSEVLAAPLSINKYYPTYTAEVRMGPLNSTGFITPPIPAVAAVFIPNKWYPSYAAEVKPAPGRERTYYSQQLAAPTAPIDWYPLYPDNVNGAPSALRFTTIANYLQRLVVPDNPANWMPGFTATPIGRQAPPSLQQFRKSRASLGMIRLAEPELKQIRTEAASLGQRRANTPALKLIRKNPPTLT